MPSFTSHTGSVTVIIPGELCFGQKLHFWPKTVMWKNFKCFLLTFRSKISFASGENQCIYTMVGFSSLKQALSFHPFMCPSSYSIRTSYCMSEFDPSVMIAAVVVIIIIVLLNQWVLIKLKRHEWNKVNRKGTENTVLNSQLHLWKLK